MNQCPMASEYVGNSSIGWNMTRPYKGSAGTLSKMDEPQKHDKLKQPDNPSLHAFEGFRVQGSEAGSTVKGVHHKHEVQISRTLENARWACQPTCQSSLRGKAQGSAEHID